MQRPVKENWKAFFFLLFSKHVYKPGRKVGLKKTYMHRKLKELMLRD